MNHCNPYSCTLHNMRHRESFMCAFTNYAVASWCTRMCAHNSEETREVEKKFNELDIDTIPSICSHQCWFFVFNFLFYFFFIATMWIYMWMYCSDEVPNMVVGALKLVLFFFENCICGAWNSARYVGKQKQSFVETPQVMRKVQGCVQWLFNNRRKKIFFLFRCFLL